MRISKTTLKYYGIPLAIVLVIMLIVILVPSSKKNTTTLPTGAPLATPTSVTTVQVLPTDRPEVSPTILPVPTFTGSNSTQEIPESEKKLAEQKTALRRLTPLSLAFGTISFDYENDLFSLRLSSYEQQTEFLIWLQKNYPAIPVNQFIPQ